MKAALFKKYGPPEVLQLEEVEKPVPKAHEILIKVYAATVTAGDCELRRFDFASWIWLPLRLYFGLFRPRINILGQELAGEIVETGSRVKNFNVGDQVFAAAGMNMGAYASYICLPDNTIMVKNSEGMSYEEAATIPTGGTNSLHFLRKAKVKTGSSVLINGAGGSIGTYATQIAKHLGATVTCVDSGDKLDILTSIGADYVIDYTQEDFTTTGNKYDAIIDIVGTSSYTRCVRCLHARGRYILGNPRLGGMLRSFWTSMISKKKVIFALADIKRKDFDYLKELYEAGVIRSVIDRRYKLDEIAEAHRYVESGKKSGHVVVVIQ